MQIRGAKTFFWKKLGGEDFFTTKFENTRFHLKKAIFEDQKVTVLGQVTRVCSLAYWRIFRKKLGGRKTFFGQIFPKTQVPGKFWPRCLGRYSSPWKLFFYSIICFFNSLPIPYIKLNIYLNIYALLLNFRIYQSAPGNDTKPRIQIIDMTDICGTVICKEKHVFCKNFVPKFIYTLKISWSSYEVDYERFYQIHCCWKFRKKACIRQDYRNLNIFNELSKPCHHLSYLYLPYIL